MPSSSSSPSVGGAAAARAPSATSPRGRFRPAMPAGPCRVRIARYVRVRCAGSSRRPPSRAPLCRARVARVKRNRLSSDGGTAYCVVIPNPSQPGPARCRRLPARRGCVRRRGFRRSVRAMRRAGANAVARLASSALRRRPTGRGRVGGGREQCASQSLRTPAPSGEFARCRMPRWERPAAIVRARVRRHAPSRMRPGRADEQGWREEQGAPGGWRGLREMRIRRGRRVGLRRRGARRRRAPRTTRPRARSPRR